MSVNYDSPNGAGRALSVAQLAKRWGVSVKKIRAMVRAGLLVAFDVGLASRPRLRFTHQAIAEAEKNLSTAGAAEVSHG